MALSLHNHSAIVTQLTASHLVALSEILTVVFGILATVLAAGTIYMMRNRDIAPNPGNYSH
jgi:hypothetical protein